MTKSPGATGGVLTPRVVLALLACLVLWGAGFSAVRVALEGYAPGHLALLRFLVASACMVGLTARGGIRIPPVRDAWGVVLAAVLSVVLYHLALGHGQRTVSAGAAGVLVNTMPMFTALLAWLLLGERLTAGILTGIAISFSGVVLITFGQGKVIRLEPGALLVLLAALSWASYTILQKHFLRRYRPLEFTAMTIWVGTLLLALLFSQGLWGTIARAPLRATAAVFFLGALTTAVAYACYAYVISQMPAARAASFMFLTPVFGFAIATLWLHEVPTALTLAGAALALAGVVVVNTLRHRTPDRRDPAPPPD